jgi:asparagine synthase (glutamine-hydrolysing)
MCGFSAVIALHGATADVDIARRMADVLRHRGPDDSGSYASSGVAFGFRRLSILDLSPSGHQPLVSEDGQLVIVFNGEIYNYVEVRAELVERGHRFRSTGDTEVLLHAYQQWGADCLPRLNGMWSFLIHDRRRRIVFGSRDRFGVKPLYRHDGHGRILLASEIKALHASGLYEAKTNWRRVAHFLGHGDHSIDPSGETFYEDVVEVPPGSSFELTLDGRTTTRRFWSLDRLEPPSDEAPSQALRDLFEDAVRLRMRSDVPVGVSLSGGLDSTSIVSAMARLLEAEPAGRREGSLKAFSYGSPEFDESQYIAATVVQTGAELHQVATSTTELWQRLDEVLWYHDEPLHSATALIGFEIYRLASAHGVKVVLTGQGADEVLAGYPNYFVHYWSELVRRGAARAAWREIEAYCAVHGGDRDLLFRQVLQRSVKETLYHVGLLRRLAARRTPHHNPLAATWYAPELLRTLPREEDRPPNGSLKSVLRASVERHSLPLYLRIEDRNSMAHSVEARLPFLDYRLVSLGFQIPAQWKLRGPWNKYVLREAMRGRIPEIVRTRPDKMGFPTSVAQWFRGPFYDALQDALASEAARSRGIYNVPAIRADLERHRRGEVDFGAALFDVAQLERWLRLPSALTTSNVR